MTARAWSGAGVLLTHRSVYPFWLLACRLLKPLSRVALGAAPCSSSSFAHSVWLWLQLTMSAVQPSFFARLTAAFLSTSSRAHLLQPFLQLTWGTARVGPGSGGGFSRARPDRSGSAPSAATSRPSCRG